MQPRHYGPFDYSPIVDRAPLKWPNGARLAIWVVPNIEYFPLDEKIAREAPVTPNIFPWSRRDYGNRIGVFRLMRVLAERRVRATVALNSSVCTEHPRIIEEACKLGWEFMGHCETNARPTHTMPPEEEHQTIARALATIAAATGSRPRGWLGAGGGESWQSLEFLAAEGVRYIADWINDDQPYKMSIGQPPLVSIPYSGDINDAAMIARRDLESEEFARMMRRQFDVLYSEGQESGRVMCIALHPWIIGVPHRIGPFIEALDYIVGHRDIWLATGGEIIDAYLAQTPTPA